MVIPVDREGRVIETSMGRTSDKDEPNTRKGGGRDDKKETQRVHYHYEVLPVC